MYGWLAIGVSLLAGSVNMLIQFKTSTGPFNSALMTLGFSIFILSGVIGLFYKAQWGKIAVSCKAL
ncbi:hypothetical protein F3F93_09180 [Mariprofundus sp. KV]|nr:hypothetical protein [Mariprofundus sp. KV]